jgi:hypothetical protein
LKEIISKTKYIHNNVGILKNLISDIFYEGNKKEDIYTVIDGEMIKNKTIVTKSKNIFSIYTKDCYDLYKVLCEQLDIACSVYQIDKEKQKYMTYAKNVKYYPSDNKKWYDFPGINIPFIHGFYFATGKNINIYFKNGDTITEQKINEGDIVLNKPTDLIKINVDFESDVIEFYIAPLFSLKNNEPGVWVPII